VLHVRWLILQRWLGVLDQVDEEILEPGSGLRGGLVRVTEGRG
jgi:hypothetical protein